MAINRDDRVGYREMIAAAERRITTLEAEAARDLHGGEDTVFVDLRDRRELEREGRIPGAVSCPRGMLEFWLDPDSPYHKPVFDADRRFVFYCASGWRSALATEVAGRMGLDRAAHIGGGFTAWKAADGPVEAVAPKPPR